MQLSYKIVYAGLWLAFICLRAIFGWIAQRSGLSPNFEYGKQERQEKKLGFAGILLILIFLAILAAYFFLPGEGTIFVLSLPVWLHNLGIALAILSLGFQVIVHSTLQQSWSQAKAVHQDNLIIQHGPYKWVRHPLYAAMLLFIIGLALLTAYLPLIILAILCIPFFNTEAKREEDEMREKCGKAYDDYCKNTGRLFPKRFV
jgi:protein-S-isoprenylcysteine O-methyltransferase Ste14